LSTFGDFNKEGSTFMGNLYERINGLCESKGIKGGKMCTDIGISKGLLTDLKMGRRTGVSAVTAQKIASYFDVSVGYLLGEEEQKEKPTIPKDDGLTENQRKLIQFVKSVPDDKAEMILRVMKSIVEAD
jgi:transcriptional regulator with XRE-family HTH domain